MAHAAGSNPLSAQNHPAQRRFAIVENIDGAQDTCPEPEESDSITDYAAVSIARGLALSKEVDLALEVLRLLPNQTVARA